MKDGSLHTKLFLGHRYYANVCNYTLGREVTGFTNLFMNCNICSPSPMHWLYTIGDVLIHTHLSANFCYEYRSYGY